MSKQVARTERTRGWIFIRAEKPEAVAEQIYDELFDRGGYDYVVIRADVVNHELFNIVVPVDAAPGFLDKVAGMVKEITGVEEPQIAKVEAGGHFPAIPHNAHGFITPYEKANGHDPFADEYRFPKSPGFNAWG